jgi:hypothetical protein
MSAPARSLLFRFSSLLKRKRNSRQLGHKKSNRKAEEGPPREGIQAVVVVNVRLIDHHKDHRNNHRRDLRPGRQIDHRNNHRRDLLPGRQIDHQNNRLRDLRLGRQISPRSNRRSIRRDHIRRDHIRRDHIRQNNHPDRIRTLVTLITGLIQVGLLSRPKADNGDGRTRTVGIEAGTRSSFNKIQTLGCGSQI